MTIGILQPHIPHYREDFFKGIQKANDCQVLCYQDEIHAKNNNFKNADIKIINLKAIEKKGFLWYNPYAFKKYDVLVLMLNFGHIATWLILLTKFIHRKKIIIWGQGISVKRYLKEAKKPSFLLRKMISMADCVWFYTQKELKQWQEILPNKKNMISLDNTISGVEGILNHQSRMPLNKLKEKYKINQERCFIFCARFNNPYRRVDLLIEVIEKFNSDKYSFIIIGDGKYKPDFSKYSNVYDFGSVYDKNIKDDLFDIADFYFQPGWVGLSVVEALAHGKPVVTFRRSKETLQCVEYAYLNNKNSIIVNSTEEMLKNINKLSDDELQRMSKEAKVYVQKNLTTDKMINNAKKFLKTIL
jgi:glycosyltransferase involved in cell wall biosynthesis